MTVARGDIASASYNATVSNIDKTVLIEPMTPQDWPAVRSIYVEGIATGNATFETSAPEWEEWNAAHIATCRLVTRSQGEVLGWAALSTVSSRCVYAGVAEVSVYVAEAARGRGVGLQLLSALVIASEQAGIWTLQAGIFPENEASVGLHERCGFRIIGRRERLGQLQGIWRDVLLMERRSNVVGI
jgi:phosphinothricin acetyltransferase